MLLEPRRPTSSFPLGIVGQSFSSDSPRHGATDIYPEEGHLETAAMAEAMYEVPSPYETRFVFSRFDAAERLSPVLETGGLAGAGDASAVEWVPFKIVGHACRRAP